MALKQPNSAAVWTEEKNAGSSTSIAENHLVDNGAGYYVFEALSVGNPSAARFLTDGAGNYVTHDGPSNPAGLAEMRVIDTGSALLTYE